MTLVGARGSCQLPPGMAAKRKYAIVAVFIVAAIFTPPDPISQLSLAIPIVLLYEVSIMDGQAWWRRSVPRRRTPKKTD